MVGTLDLAVGELYTRHGFTPDTTVKALVIAKNLMTAYHKWSEALDWMSPATKAEAPKKLDTYTIKLGYPDLPRDYSGVVHLAADRQCL